jgi:hypothetical protein
MLRAWTEIEARAYSDHLPALADIAFSDLPASEPGSLKNKSPLRVFLN